MAGEFRITLRRHNHTLTAVLQTTVHIGSERRTQNLGARTRAILRSWHHDLQVVERIGTAVGDWMRQVGAYAVSTVLF
jgi:hypothetical protein